VPGKGIVTFFEHSIWASEGLLREIQFVNTHHIDVNSSFFPGSYSRDLLLEAVQALIDHDPLSKIVLLRLKTSQNRY